MKALICLLLALMILPAAAETVQDQALAFIQEAGIGADAVSRIGDAVIVTLSQGGTATLMLPGDFDPFNLDWRFDGAADGDVALYLDHALTLLAALLGGNHIWQIRRNHALHAHLAILPGAELNACQHLIGNFRQ